MEVFSVVAQSWPLAVVVCVAIIVFSFVWFVRKQNGEAETVRDLRRQLEKQITIEHHRNEHQ